MLQIQFPINSRVRATKQEKERDDYTEIDASQEQSVPTPKRNFSQSAVESRWLWRGFTYLLRTHAAISESFNERSF